MEERGPREGPPLVVVSPGLKGEGRRAKGEGRRAAASAHCAPRPLVVALGAGAKRAPFALSPLRDIGMVIRHREQVAPWRGHLRGCAPVAAGGLRLAPPPPLRSVPLRCPITGRTYAAQRPRSARSPGLVRLAARLSAAPPCGPATWPHRSVRAEQGRSARMRRGPGGLREAGGCSLGLVPPPPGPPADQSHGCRALRGRARVVSPRGATPPGGSPHAVPRQGSALRAGPRGVARP